MNKFAFCILAFSALSNSMTKDGISCTLLVPTSKLVHLNITTATLVHAVQNKCIFSLLRTDTLEITRVFSKEETGYVCSYSVRYADPNDKPTVNSKYFSALVAQHRLEDKTPEEILKSCNRTDRK